MQFAQSNITYDAGSLIDISTGADVCADAVIINGTYSGGGTICQGPLPVTMLSFSAAIASKNNVRLVWITEVEINNSGFEIERRAVKKESSWQKIVYIQGNGTTYEHHSYSYEDKKLNSGTYTYRLKQIDYNGSFEYFYLENDVLIGKPNDFTVSQNYPNPSNPKSKIDYQIPVNGKVTIKVYDMLGREVITMVNETMEAGYYTAEFDGSNLASGVYFYRITAEGESKIFSKLLKIVLIK
jgi:hypothetical protein